jgi:apolipoprotein D and lipocalin family protein
MNQKYRGNHARIAFAAVLSVFSLFALSADSGRKPLDLVPQLDIDRYLGRWYEIARFDQWFEKDIVGATAEYSLRKDGRIAVVNAGYKGSLDGKLKESRAVAWRPNESVPGALKVSFFPFTSGDYLVFALDAEYQWVLVGDNTRSYLWFLSRTPTVSDELFAKMKELAVAQGYDLSRLITVAQR